MGFNIITQLNIIYIIGSKMLLLNIWINIGFKDILYITN